MVDEVFMKNLEQASPLLLLNDTYILLEINFFGKTMMLKSACFSLCQKRHYSNIGPSRTLSFNQRHLRIPKFKKSRVLLSIECHISSRTLWTRSKTKSRKITEGRAI